MKAILIRQTGAPSVLEYVEVPTPAPGPGEVLVRAHTIGVNRPEILVRKGVYNWMPPLPAIPGIEISGTVEALGPGVEAPGIGQPVLVSARDLPVRAGCYAEFIAVPASAAHILPPGCGLEKAACLSNYQVAWHLLHDAARGLHPATVLVLAASGGIGSALVQLAQAQGAKVIACVSSPEKASAIEALRAEHVLVQSPDLRDQVKSLSGGKGVDLVLDPIGGSALLEAFALLAPFGLVVSYGRLAGPPAGDLLKAMLASQESSPALRTFSMHTLDKDPQARRRSMAALVEMLAAGTIKPLIHARLPLAQAAEAHEIVESRGVVGKVLLKP